MPDFSARHKLPVLQVQSQRSWRRWHESQSERAQTRPPPLSAIAIESGSSPVEQLAIQIRKGSVRDIDKNCGSATSTKVRTASVSRQNEDFDFGSTAITSRQSRQRI